MKKQKPTKCLHLINGKIINAYHIEKCGAAHNKSNTLCIGCIGADLEIIKPKK